MAVLISSVIGVFGVLDDVVAEGLGDVYPVGAVC